MDYVLETKLKIELEEEIVSLEEQSKNDKIKATIGFNTHYIPNSSYPAFIFIHALGVNYKRNRVSFNGNFLGYLSAVSEVTILEVDNRFFGGLKNRGNRLTVIACDLWGNSTPLTQLILDDFRVSVIQVAYSRKALLDKKISQY
jgi:hypothetical protein